MSEPVSAASSDPSSDPQVQLTRDLRTLAVLAAIPWVLTLYLLLWDIPHNLRPSFINGTDHLPALALQVMDLARPVPCMLVMAAAAVGVTATLRFRRKAVGWATLAVGAILLVGIYLGAYHVLENAQPVREIATPP